MTDRTPEDIAEAGSGEPAMMIGDTVMVGPVSIHPADWAMSGGWAPYVNSYATITYVTSDGRVGARTTDRGKLVDFEAPEYVFQVVAAGEWRFARPDASLDTRP